MSKHKINHVALVIDDSPSMMHLLSKTRQVVNDQIGAFRIKAKDQETRLSVYTFGGTSRCVFFDVNPGIITDAIHFIHADNGYTAVRDATLRVINDLMEIPTKHGDHSFLVYIITDGEDNRSNRDSRTVSGRIEGLNDDWTVAAMVPNANGLHHAKLCGFPAGNIEVWDTTSEKGMEEVGEALGHTYSGYVTMRASGVKSTKSLFQFKKDITKTEVRKKLEQIDADEYETLIVRPYYQDWAIKDFVESLTKKPYRVGSAYYQVTKKEKIQGNKAIAVLEKSTGRLFSGEKARTLLGLPNYEVKVEPADFQKFDLFVQSTSTNRKLVGDTHLIVFK